MFVPTEAKLRQDNIHCLRVSDHNALQTHNSTLKAYIFTKRIANFLPSTVVPLIGKRTVRKYYDSYRSLNIINNNCA